MSKSKVQCNHWTEAGQGKPRFRCKATYELDPDDPWMNAYCHNHKRFHVPGDQLGKPMRPGSISIQDRVEDPPVKEFIKNVTRKQSDKDNGISRMVSGSEAMMEAKMVYDQLTGSADYDAFADYREMLSAHGIGLEDTSRQNEAKKKDLRLLVIVRWSCADTPSRKPETVTQLAEVLGTSSTALRALMDSPGYDEACLNYIRGNMHKLAPVMFRTIAVKAIAGDRLCMETLMGMNKKMLAGSGDGQDALADLFSEDLGEEAKKINGAKKIKDKDMDAKIVSMLGSNPRAAVGIDIDSMNGEFPPEAEDAIPPEELIEKEMEWGV